MENKYDKNFWIWMSISFPIMWLIFPYAYFTGDGCFSGKGLIACGNHAILIMVLTFFVSMTFPFLYFKTVRHKIKEQEAQQDKDKQHPL